MTKKKIGDDVKIFAEGEILEDGRDSEAECVGRAIQRHRLAAKADIA